MVTCPVRRYSTSGFPAARISPVNRLLRRQSAPGNAFAFTPMSYPIGSVPGIEEHAAVGRGPAEAQQHGLCFRLHD
jgi:hypothetical protein